MITQLMDRERKIAYMRRKVAQVVVEGKAVALDSFSDEELDRLIAGIEKTELEDAQRIVALDG